MDTTNPNFSSITSSLLKSGASCKNPFFIERQELKNSRKWTQDEDKKLLSIVESMSNDIVKWSDVAKHFNRSSRQCYSRYRQIDPTYYKGQWTKEEDERLFNLIKKYGKNWAKISTILKNRSGKQIRDHYTYSIGLKITFTPEEDEKIKDLYNQVGSKFSLISKFLPGKTCGSIKNRFYSHLKREMAQTDPGKDLSTSVGTYKNGKKIKKNKEQLVKIGKTESNLDFPSNKTSKRSEYFMDIDSKFVENNSSSYELEVNSAESDSGSSLDIPQPSCFKKNSAKDSSKVSEKSTPYYKDNINFIVDETFAKQFQDNVQLIDCERNNFNSGSIEAKKYNKNVVILSKEYSGGKEERSGRNWDNSEKLKDYYNFNNQIPIDELPEFKFTTVNKSDKGHKKSLFDVDKADFNVYREYYSIGTENSSLKSDNDFSDYCESFFSV